MPDTQPKIFISYRRADSRPYTGRIYDYLERQFGVDNVFYDVDTIRGGSVFPEVLSEKLAEADVVVVVIGTLWEDIREHDNPDLRRLENPDDFVRMEVQQSLAEPYTAVIPTLVGGADMPQNLPDDIAELKLINAVRLEDDPLFRKSMQTLMDTIRTTADEIQQAKREATEQESAETHQQKLEKLKKNRITTDALLSHLLIKREALELNREGKLTDKQKDKCIKKLQNRAELDKTRFDKLIGFFRDNSEAEVDIPPVKAYTGKLHNIYTGRYSALAQTLNFYVDEVSFSISKNDYDHRRYDDPRQIEHMSDALQKFRNQQVTVYYITYGDYERNLLLSMELVEELPEENA